MVPLEKRRQLELLILVFQNQWYFVKKNFYFFEDSMGQKENII